MSPSRRKPTFAAAALLIAALAVPLGARAGSLPQITLSAGAVVEGNSGTVALPVGVRLLYNRTSSRTISVRVRTLQGSTSAASVTTSATSGADFYPLDTTVNFKPGENYKRLYVRVIGDRRDELDVEHIYFSMSRAVNATIFPSVDTGEIRDDEQAVLWLADVSVAEGAGAATFTLRRTGPTELGVRGLITTEEGPFDKSRLRPDLAVPGWDYRPLRFYYYLPPGETQQRFTIQIWNDDIGEVDETVRFQIERPSTARLGHIGRLTILNDDGARDAVVSAGLFSRWIGSASPVSAGTTAPIDVWLDHPVDYPVTVRLITIDGDAHAGLDYVPTSGEIKYGPWGESALNAVTFAPGEQVVGFPVQTLRRPCTNQGNLVSRTFTVWFVSTGALVGTPPQAVAVQGAC